MQAKGAQGGKMADISLEQQIIEQVRKLTHEQQA
jgi:hypothetical protein